MTADETSAVAAAVADAHRREWAFVLAATVRVTRDLDTAEECVQDAFAAATAEVSSAVIRAAPGQSKVMTGRTSTPPNRAGHSLPTASAASRSGASIR